MRLALVVGALWVCLGSSSASAETAMPQDLNTIDHCVTAAQGKGDFGAICIGRVADPCISASQKHDNGVEEAKACAARELAVWKARLTKAVSAAKKSGFPNVAATLDASQKSWVASRDKLCPIFEDLDPGASLGGGDYCRLQDTATRALLIERLVQATSEH